MDQYQMKYARIHYWLDYPKCGLCAPLPDKHAKMTEQSHFFVERQELNCFGYPILSHFKPFSCLKGVIWESNWVLYFLGR